MSFSERIGKLRRNGDITGLIQLIPYADWLGIRGAVEHGELLLQLPARDELIGNTELPAKHGGVVAAFMENAALLEMLWREAPERIPKSVNFSLDYLRSSRLETSYAQCEITRLGSRVAQMQIRCWQSDPQRPVAVGRTHMLIDVPEAGAWPE